MSSTTSFIPKGATLGLCIGCNAGDFVGDDVVGKDVGFAVGNDVGYGVGLNV